MRKQRFFKNPLGFKMAVAWLRSIHVHARLPNLTSGKLEKLEPWNSGIPLNYFPISLLLVLLKTSWDIILNCFCFHKLAIYRRKKSDFLQNEKCFRVQVFVYNIVLYSGNLYFNRQQVNLIFLLICLKMFESRYKAIFDFETTLRVYNYG